MSFNRCLFMRCGPQQAGRIAFRLVLDSDRLATKPSAHGRASWQSHRCPRTQGSPHAPMRSSWSTNRRRNRSPRSRRTFPSCGCARARPRRRCRSKARQRYRWEPYCTPFLKIHPIQARAGNLRAREKQRIRRGKHPDGSVGLSASWSPWRKHSHQTPTHHPMHSSAWGAAAGR